MRVLETARIIKLANFPQMIAVVHAPMHWFMFSFFKVETAKFAFDFFNIFGRFLGSADSF